MPTPELELHEILNDRRSAVLCCKHQLEMNLAFRELVIDRRKLTAESDRVSAYEEGEILKCLAGLYIDKRARPQFLKQLVVAFWEAQS